MNTVTLKSEYVGTLSGEEITLGSYQFAGRKAVVRASGLNGAVHSFHGALRLLKVLEADTEHDYSPVGVHITNHLRNDGSDPFDGIWFERTFASKRMADEFAARRASELGFANATFQQN